MDPVAQLARVRMQVDAAIQQYDADQSQEIDFLEFLNMFCGFEAFKLKLSPETKVRAPSHRASSDLVMAA